MSPSQSAVEAAASDPAVSTAEWRLDAAALFDQQLWCFGYDIRRPEGNLLVEMGCERLTAESADCASCYQMQLPTGERMTLRGFGFLCEDLANSHAVFLHRDGFRVSWFEQGLESLPWWPVDVMKTVAVPRGSAEQAARTLGRAIDWIAEYEHTVTERLGAGYRSSALGERDKPAKVEPDEMAARWRSLATMVVNEPDRITAEQPKRKKKGRREPKPLLPT